MSDDPSISQHAEGSFIAQAAHGGSATLNVVLPPPAVQEQNRVRFLRRLRYLYDEMWDQSLEGASLMKLGLTSKPDAIQHHTELLFLSPRQPECPLPPDTSIAQVYEQAGQELLIIGEPGAGKSTLLLELARQLVERAEQDTAQPLPVIIPLSTWAVKRQPLTDWLCEQLTQLYDVPRRLSYAWVQTDQILPLLDGLDEVPQEARVDCLEAINLYHKEHLVPLVVCSRRIEYEEIDRKHRLLLDSAVIVQPLAQEQVEAYLLQGGEALMAVRLVLRTNPALRELITTPLMVHILTLTYVGSKSRDLPQGGPPEEQQQIIFARYIERMIERKRNRVSFPLQRIIPWLSWLARQIRQHNQTVLYLEQLQPDWLSGVWMIRAYDWLAVQVPNVLIGMLVSLAISAMFTEFLDSGLVMILLLGGLLGGLLSGGSATQRPTMNGGKTRSIPWHRFLQRLLVGILIGLGIGLSLGPIFGLGFGLCSVLLQVLLVRSNRAQSPSQTLPPAGRTKWQRLIRSTALHNGLFVGLSAGLSYGLSTWLGAWRSDWLILLSDWLIFGLSFWLCNVLLQVLLVKSNSAQHFFRGTALHNGLFVGLSAGLSYGLSAWLNAWLSFPRSPLGELSFLLYVFLVGPGEWLSTGMIFGLSAGLLSLLLIDKSLAVQLTDRLIWSWTSLGRSLRSSRLVRVALQLAALFALGFWQLGGLHSPRQGFGVSAWLGAWLSIWLGCWLLIGLFQGVSSETIGNQQRMVPNQGIRRSAFSGLVFGLLSAMICWLCICLSYGLSAVLSHGLSYVLLSVGIGDLSYGLLSVLSAGLSYGLRYGLSDGLSDGLRYGLRFALSVGLVAGLLKGELACLRHYVLRFLLWRKGAIPRHYVRFLDEATGCILLRRVGGGYSFVHRLLLDYFADLKSPALTPADTQPPPAIKDP